MLVRRGWAYAVLVLRVDVCDGIGDAVMGFEESCARQPFRDVGLMLQPFMRRDIGQIPAPAIIGTSTHTCDLAQDLQPHEGTGAHGSVVSAGDGMTDTGVDAPHG